LKCGDGTQEEGECGHHALAHAALLASGIG
jgi:hypothetical protein